MSFETIFHRFSLSIFGLVLAILFVLTPSINHGDFIQSTISSKTLFFVYGLGVAAFFFSAFVLSGSFAGTIRISWIDICMALFISYVVANRYVIQDHHGFSIRFVEFLGLGFLYLLLRNLPLKWHHWLGLAIVISGIVQAVYGMLQLSGHLPSLNDRFGISGSFFNPGPYAGFLAAVWPLALGLYLHRGGTPSYLESGRDGPAPAKYRLGRYLLSNIPQLGLVSIFIVLPSTRSRAAWVAVLLSTVLLLLFKVPKRRKWAMRKRSQIGLALLLIVVAGSSLFGLYHFKQDSAKGRTLIWKVCTGIIMENPLFGVGYDRFEAHYMDFQADHFSKKGKAADGALLADNTQYAFNEMVQLLVENGFFGLMAFGLMLFFLLRSGMRENKLNRVFLSVLLSLVAFGLFSYPAQILPIKMVGILAVSFLAKNSPSCIELPTKDLSSAWQNRMVKIVLMGGAIFAMVKIHQGTKGRAEDLKTWKTAMIAYDYREYENSVKIFESISPSALYSEGTFLMNYGKALLMAGQHQKAVAVLERAKYHLNNTIIETALGDAYKESKAYSKAEAAYTHAANMIPHRLFPRYLLARLYDDWGRSKKAYEMAQMFLSMPAKIPSKAVKEMTLEMELLVDKYEKKEHLRTLEKEDAIK